MRQIAIFSILILTLSSCDKTKRTKDFTMTFSATVNVDPNYGVFLESDFVSDYTNTKAAELFNTNNTSAEHITKALLRTVTFQTQAATQYNLNFMQDVKVYLVSDGLEDVEVAEREDVPAEEQQSLALVPSTADIKDYVIQDQLRVKLHIAENDFTNEVQPIKVTISMTVTGEQL